jgi:hypothetical protein
LKVGEDRRLLHAAAISGLIQIRPPALWLRSVAVSEQGEGILYINNRLKLARLVGF